MARFAVTNTLVLAGLEHFVLAGDIAAGTIRRGMRLRYPRQGKSEEFEILGVGFIDFRSEGRAEVGLRLALPQVRASGLDRDECWAGREYECIEVN